MVTSTQLNVVFIILCFAFGNPYSPLGKWVLTSDNLANGKFNDLTSYGNDPIQQTTGGNAITLGTTTCNSFLGSKEAEYFGFLNSISESITEVGMSIWVNFQSESAYPLRFGYNTNDKNYWAEVGNGKSISFYAGGPAISSPQDITPNKWIFLVFYWIYNDSTWTWKIYSPEFTTLTYSDASIVYPGNYFVFGDIEAYFYEIQYFKRAEISSLIVTLYDTSNVAYVATTTSCANSCSNYCHPEKGCLKTDCICPAACTCSANNDVCTACQDPTNNLASTCLCKIDYILIGNTCVLGNLYTEIPANCAVGTSKTVCTQCNSGYFLYDSGSSTTCLACQDSCAICGDTSTCFKCTDRITLDGNACRIDSIGYRFSFAYPNIIVISLAHSLSSALTIGNLKATTLTNDNIPTSGWSISSSSTSTNYQIITDLNKSQLPINLDFNFKQGS